MVTLTTEQRECADIAELLTDGQATLAFTSKGVMYIANMSLKNTTPGQPLQTLSFYEFNRLAYGESYPHCNWGNLTETYQDREA